MFSSFSYPLSQILKKLYLKAYSLQPLNTKIFSKIGDYCNSDLSLVLTLLVNPPVGILRAKAVRSSEFPRDTK